MIVYPTNKQKEIIHIRMQKKSALKSKRRPMMNSPDRLEKYKEKFSSNTKSGGNYTNIEAQTREPSIVNFYK